MINNGKTLHYMLLKTSELVSILSKFYNAKVSRTCNGAFRRYSTLSKTKQMCLHYRTAIGECTDDLASDWWELVGT